MEMTTIRELNAAVEQEAYFLHALLDEVNKVIVGQEKLIERLLIGLLADGHILLEGVPGLAKTLAVNTLAHAVQSNFQRIQFTPDLLPADLIGTEIYNPRTNEFTPHLGPLFSKQRHSAGPGVGGQHSQSLFLEKHAQGFENGWFIVNDQQFCHGWFRFSTLWPRM